MYKTRPFLYMMVGVPCSGKSTWIEKNKHIFCPNYSLIGTDHTIDAWAKMQEKTYDECFHMMIDAATKLMNETLREAIHYKKDIVWDQTNTSAKTRKNKIKSIPEEYYKIAVFFNTPKNDILSDRLNSRPGKTIPGHVMKNMMENLEMPTLDEGFDTIINTNPIFY